MLQQDLIFVGGGNTVAMLDVWRRYGIDRLLRRAYRQGVVLAGISAGANCWFKHSVSDSLPGGGIIDGLGILEGVFCPHFDGEPWRRPFCESMLASSRKFRGYAADDGAAVHFVNERLHRCITAAKGRLVHRLDRNIAAVPTRLLGRRP